MFVSTWYIIRSKSGIAEDIGEGLPFTRFIVSFYVSLRFIRDKMRMRPNEKARQIIDFHRNKKMSDFFRKTSFCDVSVTFAASGEKP